MKTNICLVILILFLMNNALAQNPEINIDEFKAHLKFLSDDKLQGRSPGTLGGDLAAMYIATQFERCGLQPISPEQGYLQQVPVKNVKTDYSSAEFAIFGNGFQEKFRPFEESLMISRLDKDTVDIEGELVFVGYGVIAPEYGWDDYKGKDVKGKIVVCLSNQPEFQSPNYNPGNTTYFGHWEYKPKIAFDKGAKGILFVVENKAFLPWQLRQKFLSSSNHGENTIMSPLPLISGILENAFDRILQHNGLSVKVLIEKANKKDFKPFPLELNLKTSFKQNLEKFKSPNVIGFVPGTFNPQESVILLAHYDHLGIGKQVNGDSIYNGAIDNASGTSALLTLAGYFAKHPAKRSVIFLATTSEEKGFLGAEYYLKNPIFSTEKTIIGLNMDMLNFMGRKDSVELTPVLFTDAKETIRELVGKMKVGLILSDFDAEFLNFRLDSYLFALHNIVTLNLLNLKLKGHYSSVPQSVVNEIKQEGGLNLHTPSDEIKPWFRYDGILQEMQIAKEIVTYYSNDGVKPKFNKQNPFTPAKSLWSSK